MYNLILLLFFYNKLILNLKIIIDNFIYHEYSVHIIKINDKSYNREI